MHSLLMNTLTLESRQPIVTWLVSSTYYKDRSFKSLKQALEDDPISDFEKRCQNFHDSAPYWLQLESPLWD